MRPRPVCAAWCIAVPGLVSYQETIGCSRGSDAAAMVKASLFREVAMRGVRFLLGLVGLAIGLTALSSRTACQAPGADVPKSQRLREPTEFESKPFVTKQEDDAL